MYNRAPVIRAVGLLSLARNLVLHLLTAMFGTASEPPEAKWLWIAGACGFAWRVILGSPQTIHEEVGWLTLGLVSLRVVSYSLGALCYESLAPLFQAPTVELQEAQSNPIQPTVDP